MIIIISVFDDNFDHCHITRHSRFYSKALNMILCSTLIKHIEQRKEFLRVVTHGKKRMTKKEALTMTLYFVCIK